MENLYENSDYFRTEEKEQPYWLKALETHLEKLPSDEELAQLIYKGNGTTLETYFIYYKGKYLATVCKDDRETQLVMATELLVFTKNYF